MRLVGLSTEPHGDVLSIWAFQTRSAGHMKAAGPMSSAVPMTPTAAAMSTVTESRAIGIW